MKPATPDRSAQQRRLRRIARTWAVRLAVLLGAFVVYRLGFARGQHALPPVVGRETQPEMIGTRHPYWEIDRVIGHQRCRRRIDQVILHHTETPPAAEYRGEPTVEAILRFHVQRGWHNIAYHYLVAPDGTVWLGRPLDQVGTHTVGHNENSVGVCLILNGDLEQPSALQVKATAIVLRTLLDRFGLSARRNFAAHEGFHRDYAEKSCPGRLITKDVVLGWLRGSP